MKIYFIVKFPFVIACKHGKIEIVEELLKYPYVSVNVCGKNNVNIFFFLR